MTLWRKLIGEMTLQRGSQLSKIDHSRGKVFQRKKHLFVEFSPSHEFLLKNFRKIPDAISTSIYANDWWLNDADLSAIPISSNLHSIFFLTLDRLLYNKNSRSFAKFAKRARGKRICGIVHRLPSSKSDRKAFDASKHLISHVGALSEQLLPSLKKLFGHGVTVTYLPHPVSSELLECIAGDQIRKVIRAKKGDYIVSILGEARQGKGYELLLEALKLIPKKDKRRLFFLFAGKGTLWTADIVKSALKNSGSRGFVDLRQTAQKNKYRLVSERQLAKYVTISNLGLLLYRDGQRECASGAMPNYVWARKHILATKKSYAGRDVSKHRLGSVLARETPEQLAQVLSRLSSSRPWRPNAYSEKFRTLLSGQSLLLRVRKMLDYGEGAGNR